MKTIGLFRLFICFPLIAFIIPDITESVINKHFRMPVIHVIIGAALISLIGICSIIIQYLKKQPLKPGYEQDDF